MSEDPPHITLNCYGADGSLRHVLCNGGSINIGSLPHENDLFLDSPYVSGCHAQIALSPEGYFVVTDWGSTNGILLQVENAVGFRLGGNAKIRSVGHAFFPPDLKKAKIGIGGYCVELILVSEYKSTRRYDLRIKWIG